MKSQLSQIKGKYKHFYLTQRDHASFPLQEVALKAVDLTFDEVKNVTPLIHNQRQIKTPAEIALMKKACQISADGFRHVRPFIFPSCAQTLRDKQSLVLCVRL